MPKLVHTEKVENWQIFSKSQKSRKWKWWEKYKWGVNRRVSTRRIEPKNFRFEKSTFWGPYGRKTVEIGAKKWAILIKKFYGKNTFDTSIDSSKIADSHT
jgi:hypothetical protein